MGLANTAVLTNRARLRPVEAFPVTVQGQELVCLRDPEHLAADSLFLSYAAYYIVSYFDGETGWREIQAAFFRHFGEILPLEKVQELAARLDELGFLETPAFETYRRNRLREFHLLPVRTAIHAGTAYPEDPEALRGEIDGYFTDPNGFGRDMPLPHGEHVRGLIAPHIDFRRGGPTYTWAYGALPEEPHDLYVILGTSHTRLPAPFCLTPKDFVTPLGRAFTDQQMVSHLRQRSSLDLLAGEWVHRYEHTIEFQVVFLQYLYPGASFRILPILCGNLLAGDENTGIAVAPGVDTFLELLSEETGRSGKKACFIASADLAHMGPRFGDADRVDRDLLSWLRSADLRLLQRAGRMDPDAFLAQIAGEGDRRRICGKAPIYAMLRACGARHGSLLRYGQAPDPDGNQVVSFASMAFY